MATLVDLYGLIAGAHPLMPHLVLATAAVSAATALIAFGVMSLSLRSAGAAGVRSVWPWVWAAFWPAVTAAYTAGIGLLFVFSLVGIPHEIVPDLVPDVLEPYGVALVLGLGATAVIVANAGGPSLRQGFGPFDQVRRWLVAVGDAVTFRLNSVVWRMAHRRAGEAYARRRRQVAERLAAHVPEEAMDRRLRRASKRWWPPRQVLAALAEADSDPVASARRMKKAELYIELAGLSAASRLVR